MEHDEPVIRRLLRVTIALPPLALGIVAVSSVARVGPAAPLCAQAAYTQRVGLVVEHGDGQVIRRCVGFNTATDTALGILQSSGLEVGLSSYGGGLGAAVCQIDNEPATYPPGCFTASGSYWVLFVSRGGGAWVNSDVGASSVNVANGDDIGFRYDSQTAADPPPPSPAGTCPAVTPTQAPTRTPAPASRPAATSRATSSSAPGTSVPHPTPAPTAGVLGVATAGASAPLASVRSPGNQPGVNVGVLLAAIGAGALIGLIGARALRRRQE
jgi:hypothetical protein